MRTRLAVDIGGTFTDLALECGGRLLTAKRLTTPDAPDRAVIEGAAALLADAGVAPDALGLVIHGTTLATNALIERRGARTALLTTEGFRDVLQMRDESRYDQYDLDIVLPEPLVPRYLRLPVPERLDSAGRVLRALDEDAVQALLPTLRSERVESVAIGFLHAYANGAHERRVRDILAEALPDLPVSLSSEVSPEMREWERFSTTAANAYVQPPIARYLRALEAGLRAAGIAAPLFLMQSGGGLTTVETACRFPIRLVEGGPAGGAIFAAGIARDAGLRQAVSFDMGGTTAKTCLIDDFVPRTSRSFEVARVGRFKLGSGLPLRIPAVEMVEIGAGGGSIAGVDALGRVTVGPESAGADPGPACYGRGGARPTVTDANLLLGRYDPDDFAGGSLRLDLGAAESSVGVHLAEPLAVTPATAAAGIIETVDETMAAAARVHAIESGRSHEGRTMIAFGGGGPVHACRVAEKLGISRILVPPGAGVGSAIGFLRAPVAYEVVRGLYQRLSTFDLVAVNGLLDAMADEATAVVASGAPDVALEQTRLAFMRYVGQGHEIEVPLPARTLTKADMPAFHGAFGAAYAAAFTRTVPRAEIEALSYAVRVAAPMGLAMHTVLQVVPGPGGGSRFMRDPLTCEERAWAVHARAALAPDAPVTGPAVVTETETATLVGPEWVARLDPRGWLDLTRS